MNSEDFEYSTEEIQKRLKLSQQLVLAYSRDFAQIYRQERERRLKLAEVNQKLRAIIDSMSDSVVATDAAFRIQEFNSSFKKLFASGKNEIAGKTLSQVLPAENLLKQAMQLRGKSKTFTNFEWEHDEDEEELVYEVTISKISNTRSRNLGYVFLFRDITEKIKFERLRKRFITFATHEIHTPLHGLLGFMHLLYEDLRDRLNEDERSHFRFLVESGENLRVLVEDLMHMSPTQDHSQEKQLIDLGVAIDGAIKRVNLDAYSMGVQILKRGDFVGSVLAEPDLLIKAFESTLKTMLFYSSVDGVIEIEEKRSGEEVMICFHSTDISGDMEEFRKMLKGDRESGPEKVKLGMGLALAKDIIEWLNGRIFVLDGERLELVVSLPRWNESVKP